MKVKLLKALPDIPEGAIFTLDPQKDIFVFAYKSRFLDRAITFDRECVAGNPDWFAAVFEETKPNEQKP